MEYTLNDKYELIIKEIIKEKSKNPIIIVKRIMQKDFINMHGPEHHFLDGAAFLVAYNNAGGEIDLEESLAQLAERSKKMPGAICGQWGVCGSVASIGACFSIIHKTGPLSSDEYYKDNIEFTSKVLSIMSKIGGPRCCKRNAFLSISEGVRFAKEKYGVIMETGNITCDFSPRNQQCIKESCPFFHKENI